MKRPLNGVSILAVLAAGTLLFPACGGTGPNAAAPVALDQTFAVPEADREQSKSGLAYLKGSAGKSAHQEGLFDTEPLNTRLKALLGSKYKAILRDLDVQGPVKVQDELVVISGCRPHWCGLIGTMILVDLTKDNILVGYMTDKHVDAFSEQHMNPGEYPEAFTQWAGKDPIKEGVSTGRRHA